MSCAPVTFCGRAPPIGHWLKVRIDSTTGKENGIDGPNSKGVVLDWYGRRATVSQGVNEMPSLLPQTGELTILLVFCTIILVPALLACLGGFFLSHRAHAGRRLGAEGEKKTG
jgi:hypothetical protein